jgi:hypothetical protein
VYIAIFLAVSIFLGLPAAVSKKKAATKKDSGANTNPRLNKNPANVFKSSGNSVASIGEVNSMLSAKQKDKGKQSIEIGMINLFIFIF